MPALKPKITCGGCGKDIDFLAPLCPACGTDVQWQVENSSKQKISLASLGASRQIRVVIVLAMAAIGIILYEAGMEKPPASALQNPAVAPAGTTMQKMEEIKALEKTIAENPNDSESILRLANMLHDNQMFNKAIVYYLQYLAQRPEDADARVDLGICYKETGNIAKARKEMSEALQYNPKHQLAHFNLGIVALAEGKLQESNEWFEKTTALGPGTEVGQRARQMLNQHNQQSLQKN